VQTETTSCFRRALPMCSESSCHPGVCRNCGVRSSGFSLIELLVVMAVALIVAAFAVPSMTSTLDAYRVRGNLTSVSGLTQRCRIQALKKNTSERIYVQTNAGKVQLFCQDVVAATGVLQPTDPQITLVPQFSIPGTPTGGPTQLTGAVMWGSSTAQYLVDLDPFFNSRGLPCSAVGVGTACSTVRGYVFYFRYTGGRNTRWTALSISPAGRIQNWFWNGTAWGN